MKRLMLLVLLLLMMPSASADPIMIYGPPSSLEIADNQNVSLESVDVSIYMRERYFVGHGNFTLYNPDEAKKLRMGFDPGGPMYSVAVWVDSLPVEVGRGNLDGMGIAVFNSSIAAQCYQNIYVTWWSVIGYRTREWDDLLIEERRSYGAFYRIIGTIAWPDGIEDVKVRFISEHEAFQHARTTAPPTSVYTDEEGRLVYSFEYSGSFDEILVEVHGVTQVRWNPFVYVLIAIAAILVVGIGSIWLWLKILRE